MNRRVANPTFQAFWTMLHAHALLSEAERLTLIRAGLDWRWAEQVKSELHLGNQAVEKLLNISTSTFERKKKADKPLDAVASERLDRLATVLLLAEEVLESAQAATDWMMAAHESLGGQAPLEACDTEIGANQVRRILYAIEWGGAA